MLTHTPTHSHAHCPTALGPGEDAHKSSAREYKIQNNGDQGYETKKEKKRKQNPTREQNKIQRKFRKNRFSEELQLVF